MQTQKTWKFKRKQKKNVLDVRSPHAGEIKKLSTLGDNIFSKKMLGEGLVIFPRRSVQQLEILAPISGELVTIFPNKQAFAIKTDDNKEVLIHMGTDTLTFQSDWVKTYVAENTIVKVGTKLATINLTLVKKDVPLLGTILIIPSGQEVRRPHLGDLDAQSILFKI